VDNSNSITVLRKVTMTCRATIPRSVAISRNLPLLLPPHHSHSFKGALRTVFNLPIASLSEVIPRNLWFPAQRDLPIQGTSLTCRSVTPSSSMIWFTLRRIAFTRPLLVCNNNTMSSVPVISIPPLILPPYEMLRRWRS
jgi:hypothetical protein